MADSDFPTIDDAAAGLAKWGRAVFGGNQHFSVEKWRPTVAEIDAAAADGHTWCFEHWERATGNMGIVGIHTTLNMYGWNIVLSRAQLANLRR